jgi:hypothetical protein
MIALSQAPEFPNVAYPACVQASTCACETCELLTHPVIKYRHTFPVEQPGYGHFEGAGVGFGLFVGTFVICGTGMTIGGPEPKHGQSGMIDRAERVGP